MIRGCTDKNVHATGLPDHLLFDHYQDFNLMISCIGVRRKTVPPKNLQKEWLNALPLRAPRGHPSAILLNIQGKMSALSALPPPPAPITIRSGPSCLRLRRPSLPAGGQGVQRSLARPHACTTDIIPHTFYGVRPGLSQGASQNGGEFLATSGKLHWDAQAATLDNPKYGMHPLRLPNRQRASFVV